MQPVYIAASGALFTLLGALARYAAQQMFRSFDSFGSNIISIGGIIPEIWLKKKFSAAVKEGSV